MMTETNTVTPLRRTLDRAWRPPDPADFPMGLRVTQAALERLGALVPDATARWAYSMYFTPKRHRRPARERAWLQGSDPVLLHTRYGDLNAHTWGGTIFPWETRDRANTVLLMHGWEGRGSQLGAFAQPLVERGYRVVALDGPAHGDSPGSRTDLLQFAETLRDASHQLGPVHAVVAHSMGGAATAMALHDGMVANRVVLLGSPARLSDVADRYCTTLRLPPRTITLFRRMLEAEFGQGTFERLSVDQMASQLGARALLVHDVDDTDVPFSDGQAVAQAWPGARLVTTAGLGHTRILRDPPVVEEVVRFVSSDDA